MSDFMKGMYILWADYDYIDKAIAAGIDTLFIRTEFFQTTFEEVEELVKHYQGKVELVIIIDWFHEGVILPKDQQFFDGRIHYKSTPCPLSREFIKNRVKKQLEMSNKYNLTKIAIDTEGYGSKESEFSDVLNYYNKWEDGGYVCKCDRCKDLNEQEQRATNANIISEELSNKLIYQFPNVDPYIWRITESWLNEFTYGEFGVWSKILKNTFKLKRKFNVTLKNVSGFWTELFTAKDYLKILEKSIKSSSNDGYWLYPQMRMSKTCYWRLHPEAQWSKESLATLPFQSFIDAPNDSTSDPEFFNKLKSLNDDISKRRSGCWFKFRRWISGWFR